MLQICNKIWTENTFSEGWKITVIMYILKSNKNPSYAESYRPIYLTSDLCKVIERIVCHRLNWLLQSCGFQQNCPASHHLYSLQNAIVVNHHQVNSIYSPFFFFFTYLKHLTEFLCTQGNEPTSPVEFQRKPNLLYK